MKNISKPIEKRGIVVCLNQDCEWMLLWWLKNVRKFSNLPIMFVDLGMSSIAKSFCKKNGYYFDGRDFVFHFENIVPSKNVQNFLQNMHSEAVLNIRKYQFSKALSAINTIFEETLFLDIDIKVNYQIKP